MTDSQKLDVLLIKMDTMGGKIQELGSTVGEEIQGLRKENKEIKEKIHKLEEDVKETKEKVGKVEEDVKEMKEKVGKVEEDVKEMKEKVGKVEEDMKGITIGKVEFDVNKVKLTLENEIRMNIRRVAEGHLDLSRYIRDIMDAKEEMESLTVRVNMLETEVREQQRKIS